MKNKRQNIEEANKKLLGENTEILNQIETIFESVPEQSKSKCLVFGFLNLYANFIVKFLFLFF